MSLKPERKYPKFYTLKPGESWESIAAKFYDNPRMFAELMRVNPGIYSLHAGTTIRMPKPKPDEAIYIPNWLITGTQYTPGLPGYLTSTQLREAYALGLSGEEYRQRLLAGTRGPPTTEPTEAERARARLGQGPAIPYPATGMYYQPPGPGGYYQPPTVYPSRYRPLAPTPEPTEAERARARPLPLTREAMEAERLRRLTARPALGTPNWWAEVTAQEKIKELWGLLFPRVTPAPAPTPWEWEMPFGPMPTVPPAPGVTPVTPPPAEQRGRLSPLAEERFGWMLSEEKRREIFELPTPAPTPTPTPTLTGAVPAPTTAVPTTPPTAVTAKQAAELQRYLAYSTGLMGEPTAADLQLWASLGFGGVGQPFAGTPLVVPAGPYGYNPYYAPQYKVPVWGRRGGGEKVAASIAYIQNLSDRPLRSSGLTTGLISWRFFG